MIKRTSIRYSLSSTSSGISACPGRADTKSVFLSYERVDDGVLRVWWFVDKWEEDVLGGLIPFGCSLKLNISGCLYIVRWVVDLVDLVDLVEDLVEGLVCDSIGIDDETGSAEESFLLETLFWVGLEDFKTLSHIRIVFWIRSCRIVFGKWARKDRKEETPFAAFNTSEVTSSVWISVINSRAWSYFLLRMKWSSLAIFRLSDAKTKAADGLDGELRDELELTELVDGCLVLELIAWMQERNALETTTFLLDALAWQKSTIHAGTYS